MNCFVYGSWPLALFTLQNKQHYCSIWIYFIVINKYYSCMTKIITNTINLTSNVSETILSIVEIRSQGTKWLNHRDKGWFFLFLCVCLNTHDWLFRYGKPKKVLSGSKTFEFAKRITDLISSFLDSKLEVEKCRKNV